MSLNCIKLAYTILKAMYKFNSLISTDSQKMITCRIFFVIGNLRAFVIGKKIFFVCSKSFIYSVSKEPNKYL